MSADPLEVAVNRAFNALREVGRIAQMHEALELCSFAENARHELLSVWEDSP